MLLRAAELHFDNKDLPITIASYYSTGVGTKRDISKAIEWWEKGARLNDARCVHSLGVCYENGNGVERDTGRALQFYRKAADKGFVPSIKGLAIVYATSASSEYLDGKKALKYALKLPKDDYRDTVAAAYARNGQFEEAVKAQQEAITLLEKEGGEAWKKDPALREKKLAPYEKRLALFESNKPYQSPPKEETP